jgi:uncharacterized OB-fold protein
VSQPVQFMSQMTTVEYRVPEASLLSRHVAEQMARGRIVGHKCPRCARVYVPPRGYCPLCSVPTGDENEVEVPARGVITTFSVITPLQYQGQEEKDDYVQATILLDESHSTVGMQRLEGIEIDDVHTGLRVEAVWRPESERRATPGAGGRGLGDAISGWRPSGEPDAPLDDYVDYIV